MTIEHRDLIYIFSNEKLLLFFSWGGETETEREREREREIVETFLNIVWEKKTMLGSFSTPNKRS